MSSIKNIHDTEEGEDKETFTPPPGPPPPELPHGWAARFDERYQQFYYVNLATKKSQWEKPSGVIDSPAEGRVSCKDHKPPSYGDSVNTSRGYHVSDHLGASIARLALPTPHGLPGSQITYPQQNLEHNQRSISGQTFSQEPEPTKNSPFYEQQQLLRSDHYNPQQPTYYQQQPQQGYIQSNNSRYGEALVKRPGVSTGTAAAIGAGAGLLGGLLFEEVLVNSSGYGQGFEDGTAFGRGMNGEGDVDLEDGE